MFYHAATARKEFGPETVSDEPGFTLTANGGRCEVQIWGRFQPGWLAAFTAGLACQRINILSGSARKVSPAVWNARFDLDAAEALQSPQSIDYVALANGRADSAPAAIRLESFRVDPDAVGGLCVEICARDQIGFLTAILKGFALFSLFPAEVAVETWNGRISDRFWLKGVGGTAPSAMAVRVLREGLQAMVDGAK